MRRALVLAVLVLGAGVFAIPGGDASTTKVVDGRIADWVGVSSGFAGSTQSSNGEFIYQDHLFDDLGPETRQRASQHGTTGAPDGDYRYPTEETGAPDAKATRRYGNNAADLQELRFAADANDLFVMARLSTMLDKSVAAVAIGLDTDPENTSDDAKPWPYAAGVSAKGVDKVITLWGDGGTITDLDAEPDAVTTLPEVAAVDDTSDNAIEARVPRSLVGASTVNAWVAVGLWDGSEFMAVPTGAPTVDKPGGGLGGTRIWNAGFRKNETGSYMEEVQAGALAAGDITAFTDEVRIEDLVAGIDDPFELVTEKFYAVVIDTGFAIPPDDTVPPSRWEGVDYVGRPGRFQGLAGRALTQEFEFYGRYQPYGLYIPEDHGSRQLPAALALHGIGGSHSTYNTQEGFIRDMGEGFDQYEPMYLITPLARGGSFYADWGEAETLAVLDDAARRVHFDPERLYLTGYSMGGYGVYRLASLYPDRFAAAVSWAGYTGEFTGNYLTDPVNEALDRPKGTQGRANIGDPVDTMENLRHVPLVHMAGTNDEIVPTSGQLAAVRRLDELDYRSRLDLYPGYEHFSFALVDDWRRGREWLAAHPTRTKQPRVVDYLFSDAWTQEGLAGELGLVHGDVWWISDLAMRTPPPSAFDFSSVQAESWRVPQHEYTVERATTPVAEPSPHTQQSVSWAPAIPPKKKDEGNRLSLRLRNVSDITIDLAAAGLSPCGLVLDIDTDGPVTIRLDARYQRAVRLVGTVAGSVRRESGSFNALVTADGPPGQSTVACAGI